MAVEGSVLWKLELKQDPQAFAYLLGTMHSSSPMAIDKSLELKSYINSSTVYFGESDLDSALFTQLVNKQIKGWLGLQKVMSASAYLKARHILMNKCGLDLNNIQSLPPMILNSIIADHLIAKSDLPPLDLLLWKYAKSAGLSVYGLESAEEQHIIYKKIPLGYQVKQLKSCVSNLSKSTHLYKSLAQAYHSENLKKLLKRSRPALGPVRTLLLTQRNQIMAERIYGLMQRKGRPFIAIGAAHLPGKHGVLRLLKMKGLLILPIHLNIT